LAVIVGEVLPRLEDFDRDASRFAEAEAQPRVADADFEGIAEGGEGEEFEPLPLE
jgi:hypothetical protein